MAVAVAPCTTSDTQTHLNGNSLGRGGAKGDLTHGGCDCCAADSLLSMRRSLALSCSVAATRDLSGCDSRTTRLNSSWEVLSADSACCLLASAAASVRLINRSLERNWPMTAACPCGHPPRTQNSSSCSASGTKQVTGTLAPDHPRQTTGMLWILMDLPWAVSVQRVRLTVLQPAGAGRTEAAGA